ncbi:MAG TPA: glycosyltransferase family 4 protein [Opitutaceae bacterium]|nr:glycosyltransferase family 4 protein [Opitutaceae bacterium]
MSRIIFLNRFYWPETPATGQLLTDLARDLAAAGHRVTVIASRPGASVAAGEVDAGVRIIRLRTPRGAHGSVPAKAVAFVGFTVAAAWRLWREVRRGDIVVAMTDPPLLGILATPVIQFRGARLVHWVQDIYPEVAIAITGHRWLRSLRPWRNAAWRGAECCVTVSTGMADVIAAARVPRRRIAVISNWPPHGLAALARGEPAVVQRREAWGLAGKFVVAYSGNLGRVHDLEPLIEAAARLRDENRVVFVFIGGGARRATIEGEVERQGLSNVRFFPSQPRDMLGVTLAVADVHIVTLRPDCERYVFPSKLYGVTAVGRPVIFVGSRDGELARLVREHGIGVALDRNDPAGLAAAILALAREPVTVANYESAALRFGAVHRDRDSIRRWRRLLEDLEAC